MRLSIISHIEAVNNEGFAIGGQLGLRGGQNLSRNLHTQVLI